MFPVKLLNPAIIDMPDTCTYSRIERRLSTMILCSWATAHLEGEPEVRTMLFASGTIIAYILSAFLPLATYPASEAPNWRIGAKVYLGFACASVFVFIGIHFAFRWEAARNKARRGSPVRGEPVHGLDEEEKKIARDDAEVKKL